MSDDPIMAALARLEAGIARLDAGQTTLRVDLMACMDRLQGRLDGIDQHLTLGLGHSDAVERKSDGVVEQNRILREQMTSLHKLLRTLEARINTLEERRR